jgi:hypothetical protein
MTHCRRYLILVSTLLLLLNASTAFAFYVLDASGKTRSQSRGHDVPFAHALKMIIPQGWNIVSEGGLELSLKDVSWGDEDTWEEAVLVAAKQADSEVRFDFDAKTVHVQRNIPKNIPLKAAEPALQAQAQGVAPGLAPGQGATPGTAPAPAQSLPLASAPGAAPTPAAVPLLTGENFLALAELSQQWDLTPGRIKTQIEKWSVKAGYQVIWEASRDYEIGVNARFTGPFRQAVHGVVESLREAGANIHAKIYEANKVLVIKGE